MGRRNPFKPVKKKYFTSQQKRNFISDFRLGIFLSAFCDMMNRVFVLHGGEICSRLVLIPEMGKGIFLKSSNP
jgi:hypothetical protein